MVSTTDFLLLGRGGHNGSVAASSVSGISLAGLPDRVIQSKRGQQLPPLEPQQRSRTSQCDAEWRTLPWRMKLTGVKRVSPGG